MNVNIVEICQTHIFLATAKKIESGIGIMRTGMMGILFSERRKTTTKP